MPDPTPSFCVTTPIYYVNARPHVGSAYTTIVADVIARRQRALGKDVWFLTGTDEHGQKIERSAEKAGTSPQQFTDEVSAQFRGLWDRMGLSYDDFIRTTEERHKRGVHKLWKVLKERGFLYKATWSGQYCVSDEAYVEVAPGAPCPECGRITETVSEENYFFKLSAFEDKLLRFYEEHPEFIQPETRRNEVMAFVRGGLRDLSVSRTGFTWGIPVPDDPSHVIYVWLDALANYITALGYGSDDESRFEKYWPAQLHLIGKEISRFHCVYWPAFLMAAGLPLPKQIVAHGWLLFEQSKMSKSRGNIVRAETVIEVLGNDALRYFLLREVVFGQDGSFSFDALVQRYNSDLANGYGNLVSRTLAMIVKYCDGVVPQPRLQGIGDVAALLDSNIAAVNEHAEGAIAAVYSAFKVHNFSKMLEAAWLLIANTDRFITETAPWKETSESVRPDILYIAAEAIRIITALVYPVLPEAAVKVWAQLGLGDIANANLKDIKWGGLQPGTHLGALGPIFPRAEKDAIERMQAMELENAQKAQAVIPAATTNAAPTDTAATAQANAAIEAALPLAGFLPGLANMEDAALVGQLTPPAPIAIETSEEPKPTRPDAQPQITIDDFLKVELRVAQIIVAERIPKADKLLRLEVDLGYEQRQILAGIAETYAPESLIGRKVVIVANLAPRKMRGLESNGMIVAASLGEHGTPSLAGFLDHVDIGARLK
jgi:methionyl-tRNA synthetase